MVDYKKQGKRNRAQGKAFELRVRKELEDTGWIVDRWTNNIKDNKCVPAKAKWAGPGRPMMMGAGFPDFIAYREHTDGFAVEFIECKMNGYLDKVEKEKAKWYLECGYCSIFWIAYKVKEKNRVKVKYKGFTL